MLGFLEEILHGVLDIPFLIIGGLVELVNGIITMIAALAKALLSLLPGFPAYPKAPSGVAGGFLWFVPLGPILAFFSLMVTCWLTFLGIKIALKWVKAL